MKNKINKQTQKHYFSLLFLLNSPIIYLNIRTLLKLNGNAASVEKGADLVIFFFMALGALIIWKIFSSFISITISSRGISSYLNKKAKYFYILICLVMMLFYNLVVLEPLLLYLHNNEHFSKLKGFQSILPLSALFIFPMIITGIFIVLSVKLLQVAFYDKKDKHIYANKNNFSEQLSKFNEVYGKVDMGELDTLIIADQRDIPVRLKDTIGMAYNDLKQEILFLNYKKIKANPITYSKYFMFVNNEEREQLLKAQLQYYEHDIKNNQYYLDISNYKKTLDPNQTKSQLLTSIKLYQGNVDVTHIEEAIPVIYKTFQRTKNYFELMDCAQNNLYNMLKQDYLGIQRGNQGESVVNNELSRRQVDINNLSGINLQYDGFNTEFDNILISQKGIFVLEVKNIGSNRHMNYRVNVDKDGRYTYYINDRIQTISGRNPIQQNNEHRDTLISYLYEKTGKKYPVIPLVVFANDNIDIQNDSMHILLRTNMIITYHDTYSNVLSEQEVKELTGLLSNNSGEAQTFEMFDYIGYSNDLLQHIISEKGVNRLIIEPHNQAVKLQNEIVHLINSNK